ncbi:hypothetical protein [Chitinophaga rhizosphaerae]|uniref:hypothetical protein n=1 Tax=Chitinophaga rhizosphaerae TaxID=1864947 RepID=UPI000F8118C4|nr:hypothetical protein [Chitinophaga rhizosphaerae]
MIQFRILTPREGAEMTVADEKALVAKMNELAKFPSETPDAYMKDYADRYYTYAGVRLRTNDFKQFVEDLVRNGQIHIIFI